MHLVSDLRHLFGPVRDQDQRPTCVAFAASDAHAALRPDWEALSCEFAFYHAQRRAGRSPSTGASLQHMLDALREDGQPLETAWPYLATLPTDLADYHPPSDLTTHRRAGKRLAGGMEKVVEHLDAGAPVILLLQLCDAFYAPNAAGVVRASATDAPDPLRRHALIATAHGHDDGGRAVLVRNSWGPDWGLGGYAWLPETYLEPRLFRIAILKENIDVSTANNAT